MRKICFPLAFCLAATALATSFATQAQSWPARPIKLVVSFPPGTTPDTVARVIAPRMQEALGQPVVVENRAGAGGNVAADAVAKSPADGYTLLVSTNAAVATNKVLYENLPYDPERDLSTISLLATAPQALVTHTSVPAKSFKEFLDYARRNPGKLSYGTTGSGSAAHLTMELLKADAKLFIVHIPYRGFPQAVTDMLAGNVETMFAIIPGVLPHIKAGKMTPLAVTSLKRSELLPEVPSVKDLGYPQLESLAWIGLLAPAKTPALVVERLYAEARKALELPDARKVLTNAGFDVAGTTPSEFRAWQQSEIAKWGKVIRATGAKPD
ncbi:MAG: tripartite tricarboxylate transporter substrate binding protein [Candidatus Parcubacteria bacterium]|nr:tripartite tricarboxylate transporter substrate binding protein [Burkholderiales bacterium]